MVLLKKSLLLFTAVLSFTVNSKTIPQTPNQIFEEIKGVTAYNATIIGYAYNCDFNAEDVDKIRKQFLYSLKELNLLPEHDMLLERHFSFTMDEAFKRGPENSGLTCESFKVEFDKIINSLSK